jgi:hypothetical protein
MVGGFAEIRYAHAKELLFGTSGGLIPLRLVVSTGNPALCSQILCKDDYFVITKGFWNGQLGDT